MDDIFHFPSAKRPQATVYKSKPTARVLAIGFELGLQGKYLTTSDSEGLVLRYFAEAQPRIWANILSAMEIVSHDFFYSRQPQESAGKEC